MPTFDPVKTREFAVDVVRQLREAGYEALWAGGCVRDRIMGREPKDYDVATNATPDQIRDLFGRRRTLAIGMSFGVITVLGNKGAKQIDVATFRRDAAYSDGRHPDSVEFSTAQEDAQRRDFTINGLYFDPLSERVIDYVGGQQDLERCLIRAIGDPELRIAEDKLRMLRAVRFASTLGFTMDPGTMAAVRRSAPEIRAVSAERITEEMRRMLVPPSRGQGLKLLRDARLLHEILPEAADVLPRDEVASESEGFAWDRTVRILDELDNPTFPVALAALFREIHAAHARDEQSLLGLCRRWRLANDDMQLVADCLRHEAILRSASRSPWPSLQRVLIDPAIDQLLTFAAAVATVCDGDTGEIRYSLERLQWSPEKLNPIPLVTGDDLRHAGIPPGPVYKRLLDEIRDQQLLGELVGRDDALAWARGQWDAQASS